MADQQGVLPTKLTKEHESDSELSEDLNWSQPTAEIPGRRFGFSLNFSCPFVCFVDHCRSLYQPYAGSGKRDCAQLGNGVLNVGLGGSFRGKAKTRDPSKGFTGFCSVAARDCFAPDDAVIT